MILIFDMDGTLINSSSIICNTINYVRKNTNLPPLEDKKILEIVNNPSINPAKELYGTDYFTPKQEALFKSYYTKNCHLDIKLYDGIRDLLEKLKKDFILTIATNAYKNVADEMLSLLNIKDYFSFVATASDVKYPKPNPEMIHLILNHFKQKKAIVIGDSYKDYEAAINASCYPILVNWGFSKNKNAISDIDTLYEHICNYSNI